MAAPNTFNVWSTVIFSDTVDLPYGPPDSLYVGAAGNVAAVQQDGTVVTFLAVPAGTTLPITPKRVNATNTTVGAGTLLAFYQV
jgi:hypothetical protein